MLSIPWITCPIIYLLFIPSYKIIKTSKCSARILLRVKKMTSKKKERFGNSPQNSHSPVLQQYAAAAAKSLQSCPTLCNPTDSSPPGPPSLGFSRQEHWSGLPFPSPMRESEKWKWSRSVMSDSSRSHGLQPTRLLCPWDFPGKSTGVGCHCLLPNSMLAILIRASLVAHLQWERPGFNP